MTITEVDTRKPELLSAAPTTKVVLLVEYDGTRYHGSQLQVNLPTVQEEIETAIRKLTGERARVYTASRTDAGVHAKGQVISFQTSSPLPQSTIISGLNYYLPRDIAVKSAHRADDSFDVRRRAVSREYNYCILNSPTRSPLSEGSTYRVSGHLDIDAMNQACQALIGQHDFASFASSMGKEIKNTVRNVYQATVSREGERVIFKMVANSFLPHQVRNTVGCLTRIGLGKMSIDEFYSIIKARRPGLAGPTAPASGLCLMRVDYPQPFEGMLS